MNWTIAMLQGGYQSVLEAKSRDQFRSEIVHFAQGLGFSTVSATAVVDRTPGVSDFETVDNTPAAYIAHFQDKETWRKCPVMQHCKRQSIPIVWNQDTYVASGQGDLWEDQAKFGYQTGMALALHMPDGRHFMLGMESSRPLPTESTVLTRMLADLQLFAVYAQEAAWRVMLPSPLGTFGPTQRLTPRELEALRWTMDGKTAWEVGVILSISERTAVLHISNAMRKLECNTKHQAVLKALRLGLIR
ncbi:autoinducer binding domain-containing protein [Roseateles koreensis]|uniref:Autoinducer binding domain-containing protein n=1 Tax=Roseateles koreensis TaxID=2987526 RepID=A0ABT5KUD8_9BURK|nr:autoinducer binding domain-containing protein [Roseateles koreensis]MDC8786551.1 autoinducer binding domain-containing protein [Roseateles koreensis]